jgi:PAS domain S-box-containing protein
VTRDCRCSSRRPTDVGAKNHSEARLAAIVDSSFDAIISQDLSGTIVSWNRAAERLFGFTADEAIGQSIYIVIPDDRHDEEAEIIRRIKLGERIETLETLRRTSSGELVPVSITISPIKDKRGRIIGASKIARDISETKENE